MRFKLSIIIFLNIIVLAFSIEIKEKVRTSFDRVYLSDIIITNDKKLYDAAKNIFVSYLMTPGETKKIGRKYIELKLRQLGINKKDIKRIPEQVYLTRKSMIISKKYLKDYLIKFLRHLYTSKEYNIQIGNIKKDITLPELKKVDILVSNSLIDGIRLGSFNLLVNIFSNGKSLKKLSIKCNIGREVSVFILKKDVTTKDLFSKSLVEKVNMVIYKDLRYSPITNLENLDGMKFKRNMKKKSILTLDNLKPQIIVKRNSPVSIIINFNGIHMNARGRALEDGYLGKTIKVIKDNSHKVLFGTVTKPKQVTLEI